MTKSPSELPRDMSTFVVPGDLLAPFTTDRVYARVAIFSRGDQLTWPSALSIDAAWGGVIRHESALTPAGEIFRL